LRNSGVNRGVFRVGLLAYLVDALLYPEKFE
jgi:K+-transporting ATPase KdpF subunit